MKPSNDHAMPCTEAAIEQSHLVHCRTTRCALLLLLIGKLLLLSTRPLAQSIQSLVALGYCPIHLLACAPSALADARCGHAGALDACDCDCDCAHHRL